MNPDFDPSRTDPILLVPYMWIGDFVRCHSVVRVLNQRFPNRPVDVLTTSLCAPLLDYMPGVRKGIRVDLPRKALAWGQHRALAQRLRAENYGTALVMPRTWKAALAPTLAGIPERVGFFGEARIGLLNDLRFGERKLPRMIDRCASLALPPGTPQPPEWPLPDMVVPPDTARAWRAGAPGGGRPAVAICPGAVGPSKRWLSSSYGAVARALIADGCTAWVLGGPGEAGLAREIVEAAGPGAHDLTGTDLRNAVLALANAAVALSNDSGLLHVAAAVGAPSIGIFGPTSAWHWAPLNPIEATIETETDVPCRPCHKPVCAMLHHRCMVDIPAARVLAAARAALAKAA